MRLLICLTLALVPTVALASGNTHRLNKAYSECLLAKGKQGQYTSLDGGKSAMRLMEACHAQWYAVVDDCVADGDAEGNCNLKAGMLAQAALKLLNK